VEVPAPETVTRAARPEALRSRHSSTLASTPAEVLYANELMRGRMWVAISVVLGAGGLGFAALVPAPGALARQLLALGCGALLVISLVGLWILRDGRNYSARLALFFSFSSLLVILPAYHFFGWFSAVTFLVALGGVIFAMGHSTRAVNALAATAVGSHAVFAGLTIAGTLPDRGIAMVRADGRAAEILCVVMCEVLIALAFLIGRRLRGQMLVGVERYGLVIKESTRREALLQEANDELRRARNVGEAGRYTGLELGSFTLGVILGRGGMGEVYAATHRASGEGAAIKVMIAARTVDQVASERFEREIDVMAALAALNIVRILEHSVRGDSVPYLAMERLEGVVLAEELRTVRRPPITDMLIMLRHVASGLAAAHAAGVVHRDLTPRNIFHHRLGGEDLWKILDFGVSKLAGGSGTLTGAGVIGTPTYMSPEQATGQEVDQRTDVFSLGCVAYRCLTGRPPFRGTALADAVYSVVHEMPLRPSGVAPLPAAIDLVLAIALAKDKDDRFDSAEELVTAVEAACARRIAPELRVRGTAVLALHPWRDPDA
jgi:serine/threonine-protein kinase